MPIEWIKEGFRAWGTVDKKSVAAIERAKDGKYRFYLRSDKSYSGWGRSHGGYLSLENAISAIESTYGQKGKTNGRQ